MTQQHPTRQEETPMNVLTTTPEARAIADRMRALDSRVQADRSRRHSVRLVQQRDLNVRGLPRATR